MRLASACRPAQQHVPPARRESAQLLRGVRAGVGARRSVRQTRREVAFHPRKQGVSVGELRHVGGRRDAGCALRRSSAQRELGPLRNESGLRSGCRGRRSRRLVWLQVLHAEHTHAVEPLHGTQCLCEDGQPRELAAERSQTLQLALQRAAVSARLGAVRCVLFECDTQRPRQHDDICCFHHELLAISQAEVPQDPLVHDGGTLSQLRLQTRPARHPATKQDSAIDSNAQPIERARRQLDLVQRAVDSSEDCALHPQVATRPGGAIS